MESGTQSPAQETQTQGHEAMQSGLAKRAETMQVVAKARENLGQVATGREVHQDIHGNLLTPREVANVSANGNQEDRRI